VCGADLRAVLEACGGGARIGACVVWAGPALTAVRELRKDSPKASEAFRELRRDFEVFRELRKDLRQLLVRTNLMAFPIVRVEFSSTLSGYLIFLR